MTTHQYLVMDKSWSVGKLIFDGMDIGIPISECEGRNHKKTDPKNSLIVL